MTRMDLAVESVAIFVEAIAVKANVAIAVGTIAVMAAVAVVDVLDAETVMMGMTKGAVLACADDGTNFRCFSIVFPHCLSLPTFAILYICISPGFFVCQFLSASFVQVYFTFYCFSQPRCH